jgi:galactokinase
VKDHEALHKAFKEHFHEHPSWVVQAPGRVNLIGEHTDYNDGFVLPIAIDRQVQIALRPREDRRVVVYSLDFEERASFPLDLFQPGEAGWLDYIQGMAWALHEAGRALKGWEGVIGSDVPIGAGLSSSAALEMAVGRAFCVVSGWGWDPIEMARAGQKAERGWVGIQSGIMDQMISAAGSAGHALLIDCRSLDRTPIPMPEGISVVILDTGSRRKLVDSAYNERQRQCEQAAHHFKVSALRDVSLADFQARAEELEPVLRRRARHVLTENQRVLDMVEALQDGNNDAMGQLLYESHISLRHDFEVSSRALDEMVACARVQTGCIGARMSGAGFGGAAVALVHSDQVRGFCQTVERCYRERMELNPKIYDTRPAQGASHEPL